MHARQSVPMQSDRYPPRHSRERDARRRESNPGLDVAIGAIHLMAIAPYTARGP